MARHEHSGSLAERLLGLLEGHTSRGDEREILAALRGASGVDVDAALRQIGVARLLGDVDDRVLGPDHGTELLGLLCRERLAELSVELRGDIVRALQHGRTGSRAERAIRDVLVGTRGVELAALKERLDDGLDYRDLHQLLFHDVDDEALRREVLEHFAAEAAGAPPSAPCVLSDIDDTLYANWKDERYPKGTVYPGVVAFYAALGQSLCFVTARPGDRAGVVEDHTLGMLRRICAPDTDPAPGIVRLSRRPTVLCGSFGHIVGNDRIAARKYDNFREYRRVYPERRFVFVGDSGQGDVAFGEMLLADPSRSVLAVFIHDVVDTPAPRRGELAARGVHLFDTYAGAALAARRAGLIDQPAALAVARAVATELASLAFDDEAARAAREAELARDLAALE